MISTRRPDKAGRSSSTIHSARSWSRRSSSRRPARLPVELSPFARRRRTNRRSWAFEYFVGGMELGMPSVRSTIPTSRLSASRSSPGWSAGAGRPRLRRGARVRSRRRAVLGSGSTVWRWCGPEGHDPRGDSLPGLAVDLRDLGALRPHRGSREGRDRAAVVVVVGDARDLGDVPVRVTTYRPPRCTTCTP